MADDWAVAGEPDTGGYMSQDEFKSAMDSIYGPGAWRQTGGWRSQTREQQLRSQGANTVRPGHVTAHSLGDEAAPGAYDIVVNGMTPQQAAAKLRAAQVPVAALVPEDAAGDQGPHLHVGLAKGAADPWGTAPADPWSTADDKAEAAPAKRGFLDSASRLVGSAVGGAEQSFAQILRGAAGLSDVALQAQAKQAAETGFIAMPAGEGGVAMIPLSSAQRKEAADIAAKRTPIMGGAVDPWATAVEAAAAKTAPEKRTTAESIAHGAGGFVPMVAAAAANPIAGIAAFGAGGYQQGHEEAIQAGVSPEVAETSGLESGALQAGVGLIPFGKVLEPVVGKVAGKILAPLARTGAEAIGGGAAGAAIQTGENIVAQQNYDPDRPTLQNVPQSALEMALGAGAMHATGEAVGAARRALRPREQPVTPAPEAAAATATQAMPEAVAAQAYRDMTAARAPPSPPAEPSTWTPEREAAYQQAVQRGDYAAAAQEAAPLTSPPPAATETPRNPIPTRAPPDYEAARIAEGASPEHMPQAIADVAEVRQAAPKGYNLFQAMKDLGGIRVKDADGNVDGDVQQALGGARMPGLINNKSGLTPDAMREALQERGWFGAFDQRQGAEDTGAPNPGSNIQDLFDIMDRHVRDGPVRHPEAENQEQLARRAELESELQQAGVGVKGAPATAAAKLAAWREMAAKQASPEFEALTARAAAAGVPHVPGMSYDELLGDVLEREAIQHDYDGAAADNHEDLIDAELTPEEHEWLASAHGGAEGEQGPPGAVARSLRGEAPESEPQEGAGEPRAGAGGSGAWTEPVSGLPELVAVDPNAIVDAWEKGWGPFRDRHGEVQDAMEHGRQVLVPRETFEREAGGQPFEDHLRHHAEFEGVPDPWAIAPTAAERVNLGHETVDQGVLQGTEQSALQAAAARGEGPMRAKVAQQDAGGLFGGAEPKQETLFQRRVDDHDLERLTAAARALRDARNRAPNSAAWEKAHADLLPIAAELERRTGSPLGLDNAEVATRFGRTPTEFVRDAPLIASAIKEFGTTSRPEAAGYVLPDGKMLDFSEEGGDGSRTQDHRAVGGLDGIVGSGTAGMTEFMNRTGAARTDFNSGLFETQRMPTPQQLRTAVRAAREMGKPLLLEASRPDGTPRASLELDRPTVEAAKAFFEKNLTPDGVSFQRQGPFYSPAERAVAASDLQSATADQWDATIRNTPGVKKEELEWLGLSDWLHMFGDEKVPKGAVQAFLRDNGVQVKEIVLGDQSHAADLDENPEYAALVSRYREEGAPVGEARARAMSDLGSGSTQFSDWKLPGGEDYHELLFTLPKIEQPPATHWDTEGVMAHVRFDTRRDAAGKKVLFLEEIQSDWHQKGRDQGYEKPANPKLVAEAEEKRKAAGQRLIAASSTEGARIRQWLRGVGVDEKYIPPLDGPEDIRRAAGSLYASAEYDKWKEVAPEAHAAFAEAHSETVGARLAYTEARQHAESIKGVSGIANAPFKSSWPALLMKRMVLWAVDHGFDKVAWTSGAQQSERYGLSQHVEGVTVVNDNGQRMWWPKSRSHGTLGGIRTDPDGTITMANREAYGDIVGRNISEVFGRDLAQRGLATTERETHFDGADLDVGGSGMRAFYDRNLVNITNDLIKKYGAKVGEVAIEHPDVEALHREADRAQTALELGEERMDRVNPRWREAGFRDDVDTRRDTMQGYHDRVAAAQKAVEDAKAGQRQPGFEITEKMREAAKEGLPLFQSGNMAGGQPPGQFQPITRGLQGEHANLSDVPPERVEALVKDVGDIVRRIAPAADPQAYARLQDAGGHGVEGAMFRQGAGHVIAWALDAADAVRTARHEAIHALKAAGLFKPPEWAALSSAALDKGWLERYDIAGRYPDLSPERQIEEAIAERYADWRKDIKVTDLPSFAKMLFQRIKDALGQIGDAVRKALGKDVSAEAVMRAVERGAVGRRAPEGLPEVQPVRYATPQQEKRTIDTRRFLNKALGEGMDAIGHKISDVAAKVLPDPLLDLGHAIRMGLNPMAAGSGRAQAAAKDFANAFREHSWEWSRVDRYIEKTFTPEQRQKMWEAADEESVIRQKGQEPGPREGLSRLAPDERAAVDELQKRATSAFGAAKALGMTKAEGLPSYVPRMVVEMTADGSAKRVRPAGEQGAASGGVGRNLKTASAQLRHRKYLETSETEAVARQAFGEGAVVVKDIRTLAMATGKLEQAVAGRRLVDHIKEMGKSVGENLVTEGAEAHPGDSFTLDHPALRTWTPKLATGPDGKITTIEDPSTGRPVMEAKPLYIAKEFEGPLKAVLSQAPGKVEGALMALKGKAMSVIMYSPLMHNAVIWGKAIPAAPKAVLGFSVYRKGYLAKTEPATMREALRAGLDPIGKRYFNQDITAIAAPPTIEPGQSWTAKFLAAAASAPVRLAGAVAKPIRKDLGEDLTVRADALSRATKEGIDRLGDLWHNTFLWDRVGDLQMGIYTILRDSFVKHGLDPQTAQRVAAHYANRYAGALPMEAMSKLARNTANIALFSRSFTMTNLGAWKDSIAGLPTDVQAQILRDKGFQELKQAQGTARGKAMAMIVMDVALAHVGLLMAAGAVWGVHHMLGDQKFAYQGPDDNEKGKENRFLLGYQDDGTAIYGRLPTGKVAEDLLSWITEPVSTSEKKLSPYGKVALEVASNDKGFGRKLYDPYDKTPVGFLRNTGRVVLGADLANLHSPDDFTGGIMGSFTPVGLIQGLAHLGNKSTDQRTAALQATLPLFGITVSKGAPGGPAMGDLFRAQDEHDFQVAEKLPGIRQDIKAGKVTEARAAMTRLGIAPGLQAYYVRTTLNPAQRLTGRKLRDFLQYATPEDIAAFRADQGASAQRRQDVAP